MNERKTFVLQWILPATLIFIGVLFNFWEVWKGLYVQWMNNDDFSYGLLLPLIAFYLVWEKRKDLVTISPKHDLRGIMLMIVSIGLYIIGELGAELYVKRFGIIMLCISSVWWLYGLELLRRLLFPLMLLFLMLPLPGMIYRNVTFTLQILSSTISAEMLNALGYLTYREGNIIDMGFGQFQVVEACNGLRFIMPMLTVGFIFAFIKPKIWWKRLVLIGITIPLAMLTNVSRIMGTGILAKHFGAGIAKGFFHDFSGWVVFMITFSIFYLVAYILKRLPGECVSGKVYADRTIPTVSDFKKRMIATMAVFVTCLFIPSMVNSLGNAEPVSLKRPLDDFPLFFSGRKGLNERIEEEVWKQVGGQSYVMIEYQKKGEPPINFYTVYYDYHRKAGDFIHNPMRCLPGGGWNVVTDLRRSLEGDDLKGRMRSLSFREYIIEKDGSKQLVYFWFQGRGRVATNEFLAKFFIVWDGIFKHRTDGALIRLVMPLVLSDEGQIEKARSILDPFAVKVYSELGNYLP